MLPEPQVKKILLKKINKQLDFPYIYGIFLAIYCGKKKNSLTGEGKYGYRKENCCRSLCRST